MRKRDPAMSSWPFPSHVLQIHTLNEMVGLDVNGSFWNDHITTLTGPNLVKSATDHPTPTWDYHGYLFREQKCLEVEVRCGTDPRQKKIIEAMIWWSVSFREGFCTRACQLAWWVKINYKLATHQVITTMKWEGRTREAVWAVSWFSANGVVRSLISVAKKWNELL